MPPHTIVKRLNSTQCNGQYFALIIAFMQRYDRSAGLGTLVATMLPYYVVFLVGWILFFVGWLAVGLPLGF